MKKVLLALAVMLGSFALPACSTQTHRGAVPLDVTWSPDVTSPTYPANEGPHVVVDAAHGNWHTIDFRFKSFADLLGADGYRVSGSDAEITAATLAAVDVFVISNAVLGGEESVWTLPTPPALTEAETTALAKWVSDGGSLLLIADHMPFPGSVEELANAFGLSFYNGYAKPTFDGSGFLMFTPETGLVTEHPVIAGTSPETTIDHVKTFTGQAFAAPDHAAPILRMPDDWYVFLPVDAFVPFSEQTARVPTRGLLQGATLKHGQGRVAVFGEAAMFTAQAFQRPDGEIRRNGLNDPEADQNAQFVLNVMNWLMSQ